jgi:hypothetical protein
MLFKVDHLGKVKSSFMLDPQAIRARLTVGNIIEQAHMEYRKLAKTHTKSWEESFGQELQSAREKDLEQRR